MLCSSPVLGWGSLGELKSMIRMGATRELIGLRNGASLRAIGASA